MVKYYFIEENDKHIIYHYYPEDDKTKEYGIIDVDKEDEIVRVTKTTERDSKSHKYGDHAASNIVERLNNEESPGNGMVMWY